MTGTTKSNQAYVFHLHTVMRDTALKSTYDSLQAIIPLADSMTRAVSGVPLAAASIL